MSAPHKEREHSKFSASGSERWLNCSASVALEEKCPPQDDNQWTLEGTLAHEVLERRLNAQPVPDDNFDITPEMVNFVEMAVKEIKRIQKQTGGELIVEKRIHQDFIHPEMFGTCDAIIVQPFGTLHVLDFKYGQGHVVSAEENTQLIQYALGAAHLHDWNFQDVELHILQPRSGKSWHKSWKLSCRELRDKWLPIWQKGVARVESGKGKPFEGSWCHWCRAKFICPTKQEKNANKITNVFLNTPLERGNYGEEKSQKESKEKSAVKEKGEGKSQNTRKKESGGQSFRKYDRNKAGRAARAFGGKL